MGKEFDTAKRTGTTVHRPRLRQSPAVPQTRQWADFLHALATTVPEPDPLLPAARKFHPRLHMDIRNEDDRLALLHAKCLRLCAGDVTRSKRLAADVIWAGPPPDPDLAR